MRWQMQLLVTSITFSYLSVPAVSQTVLKDHVTATAAWSDDFGGLLDHFLDPISTKSAAVGITITGNGERLSKVGVIFAHSSPIGIPNEGDPAEFRWRFRFFPDTASFSLGALASPPPQENWQAIFDTPSNPNWTTVIGAFLGVFDLRYVEVDVSGLGIMTTPGQTHVVVLVPESRLETPATIGAIAMSGGGAGTVGAMPDWFERGEDLGAEGPGALDTLGENWSFAASRMETQAVVTCDVPSNAVADRLSTCIGSPVQLSAVPGSNGDAVDWFSGSCGGTLVGSGLTITVHPLADTLYYARTRSSTGGCEGGACAEVGPVHIHGPVAPDLDGDCDVDSDDVQLMLNCHTRAAVLHNGSSLCQTADFDDDGDVDLDDFGVLQRCYSGAALADPDCLSD